MKSAFSFWLGVLLAAAGQPALAQAEVVQTNQLSLNHVLMEVLRQHPSLRAAVADARAAQARVPQERAWEDPMAGVDFERMGTTQFSTYTDAEVMLSQKVPISGRNRWRGKAATAEAGAARAAVQRRELDLLAEARAAYYRYANAHVQLSINDQNQALVRQMIEISRAKYQTGARSQSDVLMAETELAKTEEARRTLELDRAEAESDLNRLMNRSAQGALGPPEPLQLRPLSYDQTALQQEALQRRPEMDEAQWLKSAAQAQRVAARRAWIRNRNCVWKHAAFRRVPRSSMSMTLASFLTYPGSTGANTAAWFARRKAGWKVPSSRSQRVGPRRWPWSGTICSGWRLCAITTICSATESCPWRGKRWRPPAWLTRRTGARSWSC